MLNFYFHHGSAHQNATIAVILFVYSCKCLASFGFDQSVLFAYDPFLYCFIPRRRIYAIKNNPVTKKKKNSQRKAFFGAREPREKKKKKARGHRMTRRSVK